MDSRRWNAGDRWARAAGCVCPERAAGDWSFLSREPWERTRTYERAAGYPSRAAGAAENFEAIRRLVCGQPGWTQAATVVRNVLATDEIAKLTAWTIQAYGLARSSSFGLLPAVSNNQVAAVFDAMDGLMGLCAPRAGGLRGDSLRVLATSLEIVGHPAAAVPLYAVATAVGASGLLVEVVGVAATAWIGGAIAAVVGLCQILLATGVPAQLRKVASELDAEDAGGPAPTIPLPGFQLPGWDGPIKPAPPSSEGGGGAAIAGVGALGLGLFLLKGLL